MRRPYPQFILITALLLSAVIYAFYGQFFSHFLTAFPDPMTRVVCFGVLALFSYMFVWRGASVAWMLEQNGSALAAHSRKEVMPAGTIATELLLEAAELRSYGGRIGQTEFSLLHTKTAEKFEAWTDEGTSRIEATLLLLFYLGMFFTVVAIVLGFAFNKAPANAEEAKLFAFAIIKGLGLAYGISGTCLGSAVLLFLLNSFLKSHQQVVMTMFVDALYEVSILGAPVKTRKTEPTTAHRETIDAVPESTA